MLDMIDHDWFQGPPPTKRTRKTVVDIGMQAMIAQGWKRVHKVHLKPQKHAKAKSSGKGSGKGSEHRVRFANPLTTIDEMQELDTVMKELNI